MKISALIASLLAMLSVPVAAEDFSRSAKPGQKTLMRDYPNWNLITCAANPGSVNVIAKPSNGSLSTGTGPYVISTNRFTGTTSNCAGKRINALKVFYTPNREFTGTDTFTVQANYREGMFSVTDRFTVTVK